MRGEKRSAMDSSAKPKVPAMKPICTEAVSQPTAAAGATSRCRSAITALIANQTEVPANCEIAMTGRMRFGTALTSPTF